MAETPEAAKNLSARLDDLERRVSMLERAAQSSPSPVSTPHKLESRPRPQPQSAAGSGAAGAFSLFGKAMLGIAGAYLLRAIADSSPSHLALIAALAIAYALAWMVGAVRAPQWLARTVYACTSALILGPMLWELTLRFQILTPAAEAGALAAFVAVPLGFSLRRNVMPVLWIAAALAAALSLALATSTHAVMPFAALLLAMMAAAELAAPRMAEGSVRILVAAAADLAVWIEIYIYSMPANARTEYPPLGTATLFAPALALFLIGGGIAMQRGVFKRKLLGVFDILQATTAFLLAACALLLFAPQDGPNIVKTACLLLAAALYTAAYAPLPMPAPARNTAVFATWGMLLLLTGLSMSLDAGWLTGCLGIAAVAAAWLGARLRRPALEFQSAAYLVAAAIAAGLPAFIGHALNGPLPAAPGLRVDFAALCAVLSYLIAPSRARLPRREQALLLFSAAAAAACLAAFSIEGLGRMVALAIEPGAHHIAFLRTLALCLLALALAYAGAQLRRAELTRIGYTALVLVGLKLLVEDLRDGHFAYIAGSIFLFALTLLAAPRVARGSAANRLTASSAQKNIP